MDTGDFIKNNPERARKLKAQWLTFQQKYHPPSFSSEKDLILWSFTNTSVPSEAISGFEILRYEAATPTKTPDQPTPQEAENSGGLSVKSLLGLALTPFAPWKPQIMEDDSRYLKIEDEQKKKWLEENKQKDFSSKEGVDYIHGSLDDPSSPTLHEAAEKEFREKHPKEAQRYDKLALKLHKNPEWDPTTMKTRQQISQHVWAREELEKQNDKKLKQLDDATKKKIEEQAWDRHAKRFPEKAAAYRNKIKEIDDALIRSETKKTAQRITQEEARQRLEAAAAKTPLSNVESATKHLESIVPHRNSVDEATKRLESIKPAVPLHQLYIPSQRPTGSISSPPQQRRQVPQKKNGGPVGNLNKLPSFLGDLQNFGQGGINAASVVQGFFSKYKWALIGGIILIMFIVTVFTGGGGSSVDLNGGGNNSSSTNPATTLSYPPIPGLTLTLSGPDVIDNGQDVVYNVQVFYDPDVATTPLEKITAFENVPTGAKFQTASGTYNYDAGANKISWALSEISNQQTFSFTLSPTQSDFLLSNYVYATASSPAPTGSTSSTGSGGVCSDGSSFCSISNLLPYFNNDQVAAGKASVICQRESGSNPSALNNGCVTGDSEDYSVGLFQLNMLAQCPGAFSDYTTRPPYSCTIANQATLDACVAKYEDPVANIQKMVQMSANGTNWQPWSTASVCGVQ